MKLRFIILNVLLIASPALPSHAGDGWFSSDKLTYGKLTLAVGAAGLLLYGMYSYFYSPVKNQDTPSTPRVTKKEKKLPTPQDSQVKDSPSHQLLRAAAKGDVACMKAILRENSGTLLLNAIDKDGQGLLHAVVISGKLEACKFVLQFKKTLEQHGVGINKKDFQGNTPLQCAVSSFNRGCEDIVSLLLQNGADALIQNNDGNTALHLAVEYSEYKSIIQILVRCQHVQGLLAVKNNACRTAQQHAHRNTDKDTILALFSPFITKDAHK